MKAWTILHLKTIIPTFLVMFGIAFFLARLFRNETEFVKLLPIRIIAIIIVFLEVVKQYLSIRNGYSWHHLPFHFCSLFVFLFPAFAFCKDKYKDNVRIITLTSCIMLFLFMLGVPGFIYGESDIQYFFTDFFCFHTVFFHNMVILGFFYIVNLGLYKIDTKKDLKAISIFFAFYGAIAIIMSNVFKVNFNNFYYSAIDGVEKFRLWMIDKIDWVGQLVYVTLLYILAFLLILACYYIFNVISTRFFKSKKESTEKVL